MAAASSTGKLLAANSMITSSTAPQSQASALPPSTDNGTTTHSNLPTLAAAIGGMPIKQEHQQGEPPSAVPAQMTAAPPQPSQIHMAPATPGKRPYEGGDNNPGEATEDNGAGDQDNKRIKMEESAMQ